MKTSTKKDINKIKVDTAEEVIVSLIKISGFRVFSTALNNAMCHGGALESAGICFTDHQLIGIFDGIEKIQSIAMEMES